jgi:hypothetical protein
MYQGMALYCSSNYAIFHLFEFLFPVPIFCIFNQFLPGQLSYLISRRFLIYDRISVSFWHV